MLGSYIIDFLLIALLIIGITATNGVVTNGIGTKIFGRKKAEFVDQSSEIQSGWKKIGSNK